MKSHPLNKLIYAVLAPDFPLLSPDIFLRSVCSFLLINLHYVIINHESWPFPNDSVKITVCLTPEIILFCSQVLSCIRLFVTNFCDLQSETVKHRWHPQHEKSASSISHMQCSGNFIMKYIYFLLTVYSVQIVQHS